MTHTFLSSLYAISGLIVVAFYIPQILTLRKQQFVQDINLSTWTVFCVASFIGVMYILVVTRDVLVGFITAGHFLGQLVILILAYKRSGVGTTYHLAMK